MSDIIRVTVQWESSTVFAGERVECRIIFTNTSQPARPYRSLSPNPQFRGGGPHRERWKESLPSRPESTLVGNVNRKSSLINKHALARGKIPKPTLSLSVPNGVEQEQSSLPALDQFIPQDPDPREQRHRRSVSIVSIGGDTIENLSPHAQGTSFKRPGQGHIRAASLQVLPRNSGMPSPSQSIGMYNPFDVIVRLPCDSIRARQSFYRILSPISSALFFCRTRAKFASEFSSQRTGEFQVW